MIVNSQVQIEIESPASAIRRRPKEPARCESFDAAGLSGQPGEEHPKAPSSDHAIVLFDGTGAIREWNLGAERLFGFARGEILGRSIRMIAPAEFLGGAPRPQAHTTLRHKDGSELQMCVTVTALGSDVSASPFLLVAHDVTAIPHLELELREAQKMEVVGQLAAGAVHDFNNLLTIILGYCEVLQRQGGVSEPSRRFLTEIHKAGVQAETLARQLLTFSRKQVIDMKVLDLNAVVTETEAMLRRLIGEDISLSLKLGDDVGQVQVDPDQMQHVILNLAINARDAMPHGGRLTIETAEITIDQADYAMLTVHDTGVGMTADVRARIFEPLFTTKGPAKGTGLGLSTVKRIVTQFRGSIQVDSELGRGSSFSVYLPQVAQTPTPFEMSAMASESWPRGKETILVVEDDDRVRSLARQVLEICGYTVLEAGDGAEAIRRYETFAQRIDLLVSDVVMPFMGGRVLADRMLAWKPHLKVLFVSGYPNDAVLRQGVLESEATFLQKPFTTISLAQKVRQVLDERN